MQLITLIACVLALFFVFQGEPDVWDQWHDRAMGRVVCTLSAAA